VNSGWADRGCRTEPDKNKHDQAVANVRHQGCEASRTKIVRSPRSGEIVSPDFCLGELFVHLRHYKERGRHLLSSTPSYRDELS
jgi:hypothetical protein